MVDSSRNDSTALELIAKVPPGPAKVPTASIEVTSKNGTIKPVPERTLTQASVEIASRVPGGPARVPSAAVEVVWQPPKEPGKVPSVAVEIVGTTHAVKSEYERSVSGLALEIVAPVLGGPAYMPSLGMEVVSRIQLDMRIRPTDQDDWTWVPRGDLSQNALFKIFHNGVWQPVPVLVYYEPMSMWIRVV